MTTTVQKTNLADAFWFQEGPGVRNTQFRDSGVKLLNVANITKIGQIDLEKTDRHLEIDEAYGKYGHFLVDAGDLVIASSGISIDQDGYLRTRGAFVEDSHLPLCMNTSTIRFKAIDGKSDLSYLKHWLQSLDFRVQITRLVTGSAQKNFGPTHLKVLSINLPHLDEQKRIAAILDNADELRRKRQRAIDRLNQLGQAIFHEMFGDATTNPMGWKTAQLGDIVRSGDKINYGVVQPGEDVELGVPLIRVGDLLSGYIDPKKVKQIDAGIEENYRRSRLAGDEILIGCVGSIGTVALAHQGLRGANIARAVARVPVDPQIAMRDFIAEQIKSPAIQQYFTAETRTVAQPTLNIGLIVSAPIILPPMSEQEKFAEKISAIRDTLVNSLEHAAKVDVLFSALQHRAFQGEL
jgi:type I restriction enzyme S subunit